MSTKKKCTTKRWELCFIRQTYWGLKPGRQAQRALRDCSKDIREEPGHVGFLQTKKNPKQPGSWNIKSWLLIKENTDISSNEFSAFLCKRRCESLGSLKSLLCRASNNLESASNSWISQHPSWIPSRCTVGGGCSDWWFDGCSILCWLVGKGHSSITQVEDWHFDPFTA